MKVDFSDVLLNLKGEPMRDGDQQVTLSMIATNALQPIEYSSRAVADNPEARFIGLAAEAVAEIDPYLVSYDSEGRPDGVMYDRVLLLQVAALKRELAELRERIL